MRCKWSDSCPCGVWVCTYAYHVVFATCTVALLHTQNKFALPRAFFHFFFASGRTGAVFYLTKLPCKKKKSYDPRSELPSPRAAL